ncbi:MAG: photosystem II stability/assembly factor-like uncharacterized protein [Planctomycetota bacterium]|jgi:photosystem II stability/assembly factor-like uncharacterized protein
MKISILVLLLTSCAARQPLVPRWTPLDTGSDASLRGVCVAADGSVWISGSGGSVLRSDNQGATWKAVGPNDTEGDYRDVEALDAQRAYAIRITEPAQVIATEDGGATWQVRYEADNPASFYDSICLLEGGGVLSFGDPQDGVFEVLRSTDGQSFEPVSAVELPRPRQGEAAFAASGTCIVSYGRERAWIATGGMAARVLRTTDGGRHWIAAETPMRQGAETTGIYSVGFRDGSRGVVVGGDYTQPETPGQNAAFTKDGGRTWISADVNPGGYRSAVVPIPGERGLWLAVGRAGSDLSRDGGRTWSPAEADRGYFALAFGPEGTGYAVGADGRAARIDWVRPD